ncbi:DUF4232 domain-containing protein [Streptomyces sp. NPDC094038]|uniref:DUF4232 domain-containing protein n=1 Tax=Streptomyces sp. NPDC094038 TaxID=3366055 RepID=UPI0037F4BECA
MAATVACDSGLHYSVPDASGTYETTARPTAAATSASPARRTAEAADATGPPTPTALPSNTRSRTVVPPPTAPACTARDLTASEGPNTTYDHGGPRRSATQVVLRNRSGAACGLGGWPGLTFFGDGTIHICTTPDASPCPDVVSTSGTRSFKVTRSPATASSAVVLAPGRTTTFTMSWAFCAIDLERPYGVDIRVPGDSRPLTLTHLKNVDPCEEQVEVTPFGVTT